ncbi:MAG: PSD1 and planctomycete cytochrome C domain-containing protein [Bryobacteraceae bacterium]
MRFWVLISAAVLPALGVESSDFFETSIRPLIAKNCLACHASNAQGGLQLDSRAAMLAGGKSGAAIVPGKPSESLLIQVVEHANPRLKMPLGKAKLEPREIASLRTWIENGAQWPETAARSSGKFWSFQPVQKPTAPQPRTAAYTDIDRFIQARLESDGLEAARATSKRVLIRRATFDLIGLPPTPEEVAAFVADETPRAFAKVVDRLLSSPRYGERWARYWLDLARYSDGRQAARDDDPYPNAFRYRDWVVGAFNRDLPYDRFVKAQIAADQLEREELPALGFQALGESDNDRVDVTTRVFLGLTVGCAQCHDHKYDPIPTRDYYSLLGVFKSSKASEHPLAPPEEVAAYKKAKQLVADRQADLKRFLEAQSKQVAEILALQTSDYIVAAWKGRDDSGQIDRETLERWTRYLKSPEKEHRAMAEWFGAKRADEAEVRKLADSIQAAALAVMADKRAIDDRNYVKLGGIEGMKDEGKVIKTLVDALPVERYYFWRDLFSQPLKVEDIVFPGGVYYYGAKDVERFLGDHWKRHLAALRAQVKAAEKAVPPAYPFWHLIEDSDKPANTRIAIRGKEENPGEEAPRRFLSALSKGEAVPFAKGSGRAELAEAIASTSNPLTARVMVNRIWKHHFGEGLVRSASNFGQVGDRPTHPELLDYLAARFAESGWSVKAMHREIMMSAAYQRESGEEPAASAAKDPDNRLLWRANVRERLDAEALRDAMLAVAGTLDPAAGGAAAPLSDDFRRRALYATVSRGKPDRTMALFDFPDPNATSEQRVVTVGPMQRLFFLNSGFAQKQAKALADRLASEASDDRARIARAYELLYARPATDAEAALGLEFLAGKADAWPQYAQVLLSAAEFSAVQ